MIHGVGKSATWLQEHQLIDLTSHAKAVNGQSMKLQSLSDTFCSRVKAFDCSWVRDCRVYPLTCESFRLQLAADCRVDPRLLAAFGALASDGVAAAVSLRCEELLAGMAPALQVHTHCK